MNNPVPPLFLADGGDLTCFASVDDLLKYVEPWGAEAAEVSDAEGMRIKLRGEGVEQMRFTVGGGKTLLDDESSGEQVPEELTVVLRNYVQAGAPRFGWSDEQIERARLEELVRAVTEDLGFS